MTESNEKMKVGEAVKFVEDFVEIVKPIYRNISVDIKKAIDAAKFPFEVKRWNGKSTGLYIISSKIDQRVIYVGIAVDIPKRIYQHIGKGFSWTKGDEIAQFPNCALASGRDWLSEKTEFEMKNANWNITAIFPDPPDMRGTLESALIFWGIQNGKKPEINVEL